MASNTLGDDLISFIDATIPSVWALDLMILMRSEPQRAWSSGALVNALRASDQIVTDSLKSLERAGVVAPEGKDWRYAPPPTVDALCAAIEATYRDRPVTVVNAIIRRRTGPLATFANAFRLGGKDT
ncbi:MAG: hypothetical protein EBR82_49270 [Caulobacteraceae bacterium]|nr:hypothetical protein [Caulobacteraceae bacterium]